MRALKFAVPLLVFVLLVGFFGVGLMRDPREVPSPLIDKPAPAFRLEQLHDAKKPFAPEDMRGQVWLLNVWASWCVACRIEHPLLVELSRGKSVPIVGLNYKDTPEAASAWLAQWGDPYLLSVKDRDGRVGIDYGVYGVPETFLIDKQGVIRFKQIGPLTEDVWKSRMLPLIQELQRS